MQILNLKGNNIKDEGISNLSRAISENKILKSLNLSKNELTDECTKELRKIIENSHLRELYLRWNKITHYGGFNIFDSLIKRDGK